MHSSHDLFLSLSLSLSRFLALSLRSHPTKPGHDGMVTILEKDPAKYSKMCVCLCVCIYVYTCAHTHARARARTHQQYVCAHIA